MSVLRVSQSIVAGEISGGLRSLWNVRGERYHSAFRLHVSGEAGFQIDD